MSGPEPNDTVIIPVGDQLRYCLRDVITIKPGAMRRFNELMGTKVLALFETSGWHLLNASYSASGDANTVVHFWHMPAADSLLSNMLHFLEDPDYALLQDCVVSEQQDVLTPTRMCPVIDFTKTEKEADDHRQFLAQTVVVRRGGSGGQSGAMSAYLRNFAALLPIFAERGWTLVHSSYAVTGRPSAIFNLFQLNSAAELISVPRSFLDGPYKPVFEALVKTIDSEERRLVAPMSYCPLTRVDNLGWKSITTVSPVRQSHGPNDGPNFFYRVRRQRGS